MQILVYTALQHLLLQCSTTLLDWKTFYADKCHFYDFANHN